jgi:4-methoxybenzoate monooxygenase (O-demethylating)
MMTTVTSPTLPVSDVDPFALDVLEEPRSMHDGLRAAGPVVFLSAYGVYAMARYEHVRAALINWQDFQSGAGVGVSNFHKEKPWRTPSLLLEADPPRHDAPRATMDKVMSAQSLRRLRESWLVEAERLADEVLKSAQFDAATHIAKAFPLRVFVDAVGIPRDDRDTLLSYGDHLFNAFGLRNELLLNGAPRAPQLLAWAEANRARDILAPKDSSRKGNSSLMPPSRYVRSVWQTPHACTRTTTS